MDSEPLDQALTRLAREIAASRETLNTVARGLGDLQRELGGVAPPADAVPLERSAADAQITARIRPGRIPRANPDAMGTVQVQRPDTNPAPAPTQDESPRRETMPLAPMDLPDLSATGVASEPAAAPERETPIPSRITPTGRQARIRSQRLARDTQTYPFGNEPPPPGTSAEAVDRAAGVADALPEPSARDSRPMMDTADLFFGAPPDSRGPDPRVDVRSDNPRGPGSNEPDHQND